VPVFRRRSARTRAPWAPIGPSPLDHVKATPVCQHSCILAARAARALPVTLTPLRPQRSPQSVYAPARRSVYGFGTLQYVCHHFCRQRIHGRHLCRVFGLLSPLRRWSRLFFFPSSPDCLASITTKVAVRPFSDSVALSFFFSFGSPETPGEKRRERGSTDISFSLIFFCEKRVKKRVDAASVRVCHGRTSGRLP